MEISNIRDKYFIQYQHKIDSAIFKTRKNKLMLLHTMPLRTFTNTAIRGKIHFCCHFQFLIGCLVFHTVTAIFSHVTEGYIYYG